jgi:DNA mismatch repair protein MutS
LQNGFISNPTLLTDKESLWIITGPNMGGKSTYLRQVALISLMAQCGSFVPAKQANLPILDRIFTRIGASDALADGKSTFLLEMEETATICSQATKNSLVILDEVGRGTSTFDGLAIAYAVVEYIYQIIGARCLFATHYHELTHLKEIYDGIASYHMTSKQVSGGIVFLHKIIKGVADGSFGLEVARLANLPEKLIKRAYDVLDKLRIEHTSSGPVTTGVQQNSSKILKENKKLCARLKQLNEKIQQQNKVLNELSSIDYDNLSPRKAFDLLWKLKG